MREEPNKRNICRVRLVSDSETQRTPARSRDNKFFCNYMRAAILISSIGKERTERQ